MLLALIFGGFAFSVHVPRAKALGNVTLSATFHDDDAEDTHKATQWVVRDGATTIFDSGTDTTNKESIVLNASYFTAGTTYYWKVRMQDNHNQWSAYTAESSFTYGSAPTPTPTVTATTTSTATSTATSTSTTTTTSTSTKTITPTPTSTSTASATVTTTASSFVSTTPELNVMGAQIISPNGGEYFKTGSMMDVDYYASPGHLVTDFAKSNTCLFRPSSWYHDLYISTDGGLNFEKIVSNIDYTQGCQYVGSSKGSNYIRVHTSWLIPDDRRLVGANVKLAIVVYQKDNLGDYGLGNKFSTTGDWLGDQFYYLASDPSDKTFSITSQNVSLILNEPNSQTKWMEHENGHVSWLTSYSSEQSPRVSAVNIYLSTNGGSSYPYKIAGDYPNTGQFDFKVLSKYTSDQARVKIEGIASDGTVVAITESDLFLIQKDLEIRGCVGNCICVGSSCFGGGTINEVLVLGTLAALAIPYLLAILSALPLAMKFLGFLGPAAQQLFGPLLSQSAFLMRIGEVTGSSIFFPPTKKGQESWGTVYDSLSKKPVSGAVVKIYTEFSGRLKDVKYTNKNGEFAMFVPNGTYRLIVIKSGYRFPSSVVIAKRDGKYIDVYRGEYLDIKTASNSKRAPINVSIPMDAVGFSLYEAVFATSVSFGKRFFTIIRYPMTLFGLFLSLYLALKYGYFVQYLILALYVVVIAFDIRGFFKSKNYGRILDQGGGALERVIVRALGKTGKIKATAVTDEDGRFIFNLNPGQYTFIASRNGFATSKVQYVDIAKPSDLGQVVLRMIKINK